MRKGKEDNITEILKLIAPGTPIRDGLENILRARTGALLLITDNNEVLKEVVDGGFTIKNIHHLNYMNLLKWMEQLS